MMEWVNNTEEDEWELDLLLVAVSEEYMCDTGSSNQALPQPAV